eukprot:SAG22_NODE_2595_length_2404_cov_1.916269_3_plen_133_part_01
MTGCGGSCCCCCCGCCVLRIEVGEAAGGALLAPWPPFLVLPPDAVKTEDADDDDKARGEPEDDDKAAAAPACGGPYLFNRWVPVYCWESVSFSKMLPSGMWISVYGTSACGLGGAGRVAVVKVFSKSGGRCVE